MFCPNCGTQNADNVAFCAGCGMKLGAQQAPVQPEPQQPVYQQPVYEQPTYQQPVYEQPAYQQPQQPVYQAQPSYQTYQQPATVPGKGMGIAAMIVGIVSLALFCLWYVAIPCAIVGAILGGVAMNKAKQVGMKNSPATAGVICSCIALGLAILFIILAVAVAGELVSDLNSYSYYY